MEERRGVRFGGSDFCLLTVQGSFKRGSQPAHFLSTYFLELHLYRYNPSDPKKGIASHLTESGLELLTRKKKKKKAPSIFFCVHALQVGLFTSPLSIPHPISSTRPPFFLSFPPFPPRIHIALKMDEHFAKIRTQLSSKLPNQQMHATTLLAVEEVLLTTWPCSIAGITRKHDCRLISDKAYILSL